MLAMVLRNQATVWLGYVLLVVLLLKFIVLPGTWESTSEQGGALFSHVEHQEDGG